MKSQPASCLMPQGSQSHSNVVAYQRLTLLLHYEEKTASGDPRAII